MRTTMRANRLQTLPTGPVIYLRVYCVRKHVYLTFFSHLTMHAHRLQALPTGPVIYLRLYCVFVCVKMYFWLCFAIPLCARTNFKLYARAPTSNSATGLVIYLRVYCVYTCMCTFVFRSFLSHPTMRAHCLLTLPTGPVICLDVCLYVYVYSCISVFFCHPTMRAHRLPTLPTGPAIYLRVYCIHVCVHIYFCLFDAITLCANRLQTLPTGPVIYLHVYCVYVWLQKYFCHFLPSHYARARLPTLPTGPVIYHGASRQSLKSVRAHSGMTKKSQKYDCKHTNIYTVIYVRAYCGNMYVRTVGICVWRCIMFCA